jgi:hypothetical protein
VILGLLLGGILSGQALIRAAELRSVSTEYQKYVTAVGTFRDKYLALPGDMPNATAFWNAAHATPATCYTTQGTGTQTCNGDGNGLVDGVGGADVHELFRFWQHLANAGLIEGTYTGINTAAGCWIVTVGGTNAPNAKLAKGIWAIREPLIISAGLELFAQTYTHWLQLGAATGCDNYGRLFKPEELWNIDTKIDDGKPAQGKVMMRGTIASCTTTADSTDLSADYALSNNDTACLALFNRAF